MVAYRHARRPAGAHARIERARADRLGRRTVSLRAHLGRPGCGCRSAADVWGNGPGVDFASQCAAPLALFADTERGAAGDRRVVGDAGDRLVQLGPDLDDPLPLRRLRPLDDGPALGFVSPAAK
jgi:hypothetical protein